MFQFNPNFPACSQKANKEQCSNTWNQTNLHNKQEMQVPFLHKRSTPYPPKPSRLNPPFPFFPNFLTSLSSPKSSFPSSLLNTQNASSSFYIPPNLFNNSTTTLFGEKFLNSSHRIARVKTSHRRRVPLPSHIDRNLTSAL